MKKYLALAIACVLTATMSGCPEGRRQPRHTGENTRHFHTANVPVQHFSDGRYGYHGDDGFWYWYLLSQNTHTNNYYTGSVSQSSPSSVGALPVNGGWVRGDAPKPEDVQAATPTQVAVVESANGTPVTPTEAQSSQQEIAEVEHEVGLSPEGARGDAEPGNEAAADGGAGAAPQAPAENDAPAEAPGEAAGDSTGGSTSSGDSVGGSSSGGDSGGSSGGGDGGGSGGGE